MRSKFRQGRFGGMRREMGEDVNPSAYIVNLADCMLVLACGFMVAMISYWNIDINVAELDSDQMEQVDTEVIPEDITGQGSNYVEAGKVYMDSVTGEYYIIKEAEPEAADQGEDPEQAEASEDDEAAGGDEFAEGEERP